jgi:hypothetical protein
MYHTTEDPRPTKYAPFTELYIYSTSPSAILTTLLSICTQAIKEPLLNQQKTFFDPRLAQDKILCVPSLYCISQTLLTICIGSHLRRLGFLLADRRDLRLAMACITCRARLAVQSTRLFVRSTL